MSVLSESDVWRKYDADEQRLSAPLSERMLELAQLRAGMRVLDLATGRGEPAIRAARRVGESGSVVGVDPSTAMMQMARERAAGEGVGNLHLIEGSAEALPTLVDGTFDAVLVRWGLMYMGSPVDALAAALRVMRTGARLVAAVVAEPERAPYFNLPRIALARYCAVAAPSDGPGTFRYADRTRLARDFSAAELVIAHEEELHVDVMEAPTDSALIAWVRAFGMERLIAELPDTTQRAWGKRSRGGWDERGSRCAA